VFEPKKPRHKRAVRKQRLTELFVAKAGPKKHLGLTWDSLQRGLALRVSDGGNRSWVCVYSRLGRARWLTLGNARDIGLADARIMAGEVMLAAAKGADPASEKAAQRSSGSFGELADRYLNEHAKKHNKSWPQARALVERHAISKWKNLQAAAVTKGDIKQMMARIEAPITANQTLAAVSAIFSWAIREEILPPNSNPCAGVARNATKDRERVLADSEFPAFWNAFTEIGGNIGAALKAVLLTGQRPGEICAMRYEHIRDGFWEMPGEVIPGIWPGTKNGRSHRVWLSAPVQELIANLGTDRAAGYIFGGERGRPPRGLDEAMRTACAKIGATRATPHDLRRSFLTQLIGLEFGRDAMDRIANHHERKGKQKTTDVYDRHNYGPTDQKIMEAVADKIMTLVAPPTDAEEAKKVVRGRQFRR
jgi:integrase